MPSCTFLIIENKKYDGTQENKMKLNLSILIKGLKDGMLDEVNALLNSQTSDDPHQGVVWFPQPKSLLQGLLCGPLTFHNIFCCVRYLGLTDKTEFSVIWNRKSLQDVALLNPLIQSEENMYREINS